MDTTRKLAEWIVDAKLSAMPAQALATAKLTIIDTVGCMVAARLDPSANIIMDFVRSNGGAPQASVIGGGFRTSVGDAALANGTLAHILDYDDGNYTMGGHASAPLLPAVLAVAESCGATGADVLTAYIVGVEIEAKIGGAINNRHYELGWHPTPTLGTLGAAAAAAKLLQLDKRQAQMSLGIAASQAGGLRQNFGTMTKPFHCGQAARAGAVSAQLAKQGFTASDKSIEGEFGFCRLFTDQEHIDYDKIINTLGAPLDVVKPGMDIKLYPCCAATHSSIDIVRGMMERYGIGPDDIERIECGVNYLRPSFLMYTEPATGLQGKFSMQFCIAMTLLEGKPVLQHFSDAKVNEPRVRELMKRIHLFSHPELSMRDRLHQGAIVTVTLKDGRTLSDRVECHRGYADLPLTSEEVDAKYHECAGLFLTEKQVERSLAKLKSLEFEKEIGSLMSILVDSGTPASMQTRPAPASGLSAVAAR